MHIVSLALGGCLKAEPVRYGITEDTGGHIAYILGEMEALSRRDDVTLAEIVTRRFDDERLGRVHSKSFEQVSPKFVIRRIDSGNPNYLSKEALGADRDAFTRAFIADLRARRRLPDLIHAHFADAADVARKVEAALGIPYIYTAHSLGMDKRVAMERSSASLNARIAEEDRAIAGAGAIIGSSRDECERQLLAYPSARIGTIHRLIPGIDRALASASTSAAFELVEPFLRDPTKPMILAIARPVHKKNLAALVDAFGCSARLRENCNLVILPGQRVDPQSGEQEQQDVMRDLLFAIDRQDLYGCVAYPRAHSRQAVQALYTLAAKTHGVFVNPALIEPYGLTLVEAASHGLPVVATRVGGAQDIVAELEHGLSVDPTDTGAIGAAIERLIFDRGLWHRCARNGRANSAGMTWETYATGFLAIAKSVVEPSARSIGAPRYLLVSDLDNTLTGCREGIERFARFLARQPSYEFVIATGRSIVEARRLVRDWALPEPIAWITSVGTEIYREENGSLSLDAGYAKAIEEGWDPNRVDRALDKCPGLAPQASYEQRPWKRSYFAHDPQTVEAVRAVLAGEGVPAHVLFSHDRMLDVLPPNAGKAAAMVRVAQRFRVPPENIFAAGDSGNDSDMLTACENAILVRNHASEVANLARRPNVYLSRRSHASGALEGILVHRRAHSLRAREITKVLA